MLEVMNLQYIEDYARRIFQYAEMKEEEVDSSKQKGFLASCISHSTHRFTRGLKRYVKFSDKEHKVFAVCCFSILANATDLQTVKKIFKLMCETFITPFENDKSQKARKTLQNLIEQRPDDTTEIIKCINEVYPNLLESESESETDSEHRNENCNQNLLI